MPKKEKDNFKHFMKEKYKTIKIKKKKKMRKNNYKYKDNLMRRKKKFLVKTMKY